MATIWGDECIVIEGTLLNPNRHYNVYFRESSQFPDSLSAPSLCSLPAQCQKESATISRKASELLSHSDIVISSQQPTSSSANDVETTSSFTAGGQELSFGDYDDEDGEIEAADAAVLSNYYLQWTQFLTEIVHSEDKKRLEIAENQLRQERSNLSESNPPGFTPPSSPTPSTSQTASFAAAPYFHVATSSQYAGYQFEVPAFAYQQLCPPVSSRFPRPFYTPTYTPAYHSPEDHFAGSSSSASLGRNYWQRFPISFQNDYRRRPRRSGNFEEQTSASQSTPSDACSDQIIDDSNACNEQPVCGWRASDDWNFGKVKSTANNNEQAGTSIGKGDKDPTRRRFFKMLPYVPSQECDRIAISKKQAITSPLSLQLGATERSHLDSVWNVYWMRYRESETTARFAVERDYHLNNSRLAQTERQRNAERDEFKRCKLEFEQSHERDVAKFNEIVANAVSANGQDVERLLNRMIGQIVEKRVPPMRGYPSREQTNSNTFNSRRYHTPSNYPRNSGATFYSPRFQYSANRY